MQQASREGRKRDYRVDNSIFITTLPNITLHLPVRSTLKKPARGDERRLNMSNMVPCFHVTGNPEG
jgi:hypothetical protein